MAAPSWIVRLKQRWKLENAWQVVVVLVVFACTGFTVYFLKRPILKMVAEDFGHAWWISALYYIFILPVYNVLLLTYGLLFGQFRFFWEFEKRLFCRLLPKKDGDSTGVK
jgi:hypothetical protein